MSEPAWTREPPAELGYYWADRGDGLVEVVILSKDDDGLYVDIHGYDRGTRLDDWKWWWPVRVEPPATPTPSVTSAGSG